MEQQYGKQGVLWMLSVMHKQLNIIDCVFHRRREKAQVTKNPTCLERMLFPFGDQNEGQSF